VQLAVHTLPFGGVDESGVGSYYGKISFDAFSHQKAILCCNFWGDDSIRHPLQTNTKMRFLKALMSGDLLGIIRVIF